MKTFIRLKKIFVFILSLEKVIVIFIKIDSLIKVELSILNNDFNIKAKLIIIF